MAKKQIHISRSRIAIVIFSIVACAALLLTFAPRHTTQFGYEYQREKPWRYSTLIAEFDFPVLRSEEEQQLLRDSIRAAYQPYYQLQTSVGEQQIALFKQEVAEGKFVGIPKGALLLAEQQLRRIYAQGFMSVKDYSEVKSTYPRGIRIVNQQRAVSRNTEDVLSTRTAYEAIIASDSLHRW